MGSDTEVAAAVDTLAARANGSFRYAFHITEDLHAGRRSLTDVATSPRALGDLYEEFLDRERGQLSSAWETVYQPILATLTASAEPAGVRKAAELATTWPFVEAKIIALGPAALLDDLAALPLPELAAAVRAEAGAIARGLAARLGSAYPSLPYKCRTLVAEVDVMTMIKTRRLELRTDETTDRMIAEAAELMHMTKSAFVADAARQAAERVIARADVTLMAPAVFDAMMAALNRPDESAELAALAALPKRILR